MAEMTESCCFNYIRDQCKGSGCPCGCHEVYPQGSLDESTRLGEEIAALRAEMDRYRQRSRDEDTTRIRLNHDRIELRDMLANVVGAFTGGIYCTNCGESIDDGCLSDCVIGRARKVLR